MATFDPTKASPSRYANFLDCPMKYWIFNLHPRAKEFRNKGKSIGIVVDQTIHRFFSRPADNRTEESLEADFDLVWLKERDNIGDWCVLPSEEENCKRDAWQVVEAFFRNFDVKKNPVYIPPLNGLPNRFDLMIKVPVAPDLLIQGYGDRLDEIDGGYEVIDYKTKTGAELYEEKNNLQLRMYALLFDDWLKRKSRAGKIIKVSFLYLTPRGVEKREYSFTDTDRVDTISQVIKLRGKIREHYQKYGVNPWPCTCGTCTRLLAKMEERADEWARGIVTSPTQTSLIQDIPF
jgi:RecB family exonuclease